MKLIEKYDIYADVEDYFEGDSFVCRKKIQKEGVENAQDLEEVFLVITDSHGNNSDLYLHLKSNIYYTLEELKELYWGFGCGFRLTVTVMD